MSRPVGPNAMAQDAPVLEGGGDKKINARDQFGGRLTDAGSSALTFDRLGRAIIERWSIVALTAGLSLALVIVALFIIKPSYTAAVSVIATNTVGSTAATSATARLAGLIGGGEGADSPVTPFSQYHFALTSAAVAQRLIDRSDVLKILFAAEWGATTQSWHPPQSRLKRLTAAITRIFGHQTWHQPDAVRLSEFLAANITFSQEFTTHVSKITFQYPDREFAVALLSDLHKETVSYLREVAQRHLQVQVNYLNNKIGTVASNEERRALTEMLLTVETQLLSSQEGMPFAAEVIDGPIAPALPTSPKPIFLMIIGLVVGAVGGTLIAVILECVAPRRRPIGRL